MTIPSITHRTPKYAPLVELHPAYLAKLLCSVLAGFLGIHVLVTLAAEREHFAVTDGQLLSAVVLVAALAVPFLGLSRVFRHPAIGVPTVVLAIVLMAFLLTFFHAPVLHLWWWMGLAGGLVLLALAVIFGSAHPSTEEDHIDARNRWADAAPLLAWGWPLLAALGCALTWFYTQH